MAEGHGGETRPQILGAEGVRFHEPSVCAGQTCCLHNPSAHHMVDWDMNLRSSYLMERICPHGIGHPDPDSLAYFKARGQDFSIHGCDGCCSPPPEAT